MTGPGRLAVCAGLATLTSACALLPLVHPATWMLQAALLVCAQGVVGAVARRIPLARPVTVAAQLVVSLLLLTAVFTHTAAVGGLLPGPDAFARYGELLQAGAHDVQNYAIPAPVTDGIRLMLVGGVLAIALLVDVLAVTYRSAAPAGLPLLALYSVAAGLDEGGARWLWFLCAAGGYLLLLLAEGRERLSRWGRVFGDRVTFGSRTHEPGSISGTAVAPVRAGRRIGALTLGIALAVPAVLPSLGGGLLDSLGGSGAGRGSGSGTVSAVNPLVALQDSLNQPENRTVMTYRTDTQVTDEMYLRIVALDQFDGSAWRPSERRITEVPDPLPPPPGLDPDVRTDTVTTTITAADWYAQNWLPMPYPASRVDIDGRWRFEPEGRTLVGDRGQTTRGAHYTVRSLLVQPTPEQLAQAGQPDQELVEEYTQVPKSLPSVVHEEAVRITRGADNAYEQAMRLQEYFAVDGGFTYDTEVRAGSGSAAIANFLEQKEGFCVHFAFSMAAMARTLGVPARVAVGFTPGIERTDGRTEVGLQDAHAWPELYFEGVGWTRFEPTPARGSTPAYALPEETGGGDADSRVPERPQASDEPVPLPSESAECTAEEKKLDPLCGQPGASQGGGSSDGGTLWGRTALIVAAVLLLAGLPLLPLLWRWRVRARRLGGPPSRAPAVPRAAGGAARGAGPDPEEAVRIRRWTCAMWQELLDIGWDYGVVPEGSATPRTAAARLVRDGELGPAAEEAAHRLALAVEQALYARAPRPAAGLPADVRRVRAALHEGASRSVRLRALLLPRSAIRVIWDTRERWTARADRWRNVLRVGVAK